MGTTQGSFDLWVLKLNSGGKILWSKTYGGTDYEEEYGLALNADNSF
ncbi:hypothetical protein [Niastella yeongjuensis]|nr:hypothetical protein [Niastella yeongjuensis]